MRKEFPGWRVAYGIIVVVAVLISFLAYTATSKHTNDQVMRLVIPLALGLGLAIPATTFLTFRLCGLDEWYAQTPLMLSKQQLRHLTMTKKLVIYSAVLFALSFVSFTFIPTALQGRTSGGFFLGIGLMIIGMGLRIVIKRQYRLRGMLVRGLSPVLYGWTVVFFGSFVSVFGLTALILPFGFFAHL